MRLLTAALVLALAGCAAWMPIPPPPPPTGPVPDIAGTWRGTWGGEPVSLLITAQDADVGYSGVAAGGFHLGSRRPGVAGVLTSTIRGTSVSARAEGWLGMDARGRLVLLLQSEMPDGSQRLTLARVADDRLQGSGESSFSWGPRGPAQLTRHTR